VRESDPMLGMLHLNVSVLSALTGIHQLMSWSTVAGCIRRRFTSHEDISSRGGNRSWSHQGVIVVQVGLGRGL
jgi:predicted nucleic acid-binding OB-fold protein